MKRVRTCIAAARVVRIPKFLAAVAAVCLTTIGTAYASTVPISGNYTVTYAPSAPGQYSPTFTYSLNHTLFTENVPVDSLLGPLNFFTINPSGSCDNGSGCTNHTQSGTVTVAFNFTETVGGATATLTESGLYQAKYSGTYLSCSGKSGSGQSDCINWDTTTPVPVTFTNGDVLGVTLYDAEDWSIKPKIGFEFITPLPASLPLFAGGLGLLGLLGWRRKRKVAALAA